MVRLIIYFFTFWVFSSCRYDYNDPVRLSDHPSELEIFSAHYVSTNLNERDMAISPAGDEIIYTLGNFDQTNRCLVHIQRTQGKWGAKKILSFSGQYNDIEPFFSTDGSQLFFASDRPLTGEKEIGDYNLWVSKKSAKDWLTPFPLDSIINTDNDEFYPAVSKKGNLYFTATRVNGVGQEDIFVSEMQEGKYQEPQPLDTMINSTTFEFNAFISPNEDLLIFSSYGRADDLGGGDLYFSIKDMEGKWSKAKNLGLNINSEKLDYCPFIDYKNGNFYFTSNRSYNSNDKISTVEQFTDQANDILNGMGNIYRIDLNQLGF